MTTGSPAKNRTTKADQARATRRKVVAAATDLFLRDGFVTTTMAAIAKQAGVAVQTLYLSFGSKTAILQAAFDHALRGDDAADLSEQDWFGQVLSDPDGPASLRLMCERSAEVIARAAPLFEVMRAAAADPEVGGMLAHNKKLRFDGYRRIVDAITTRGGFDADLSADDAHAILYTLLSEDGYLLMVTEHRWDPDRWSAWVADTTLAQFFPTAPR